jgi:hypothetical protein
MHSAQNVDAFMCALHVQLQPVFTLPDTAVARLLQSCDTVQVR